MDSRRPVPALRPVGPGVAPLLVLLLSVLVPNVAGGQPADVAGGQPEGVAGGQPHGAAGGQPAEVAGEEPAEVEAPDVAAPDETEVAWPDAAAPDAAGVAGPDAAEVVGRQPAEPAGRQPAEGAGRRPAGVAAQTAAEGLTAAQVSRIDSIFREWDRADAPGAAVAVTRNGRTVFSRGYGSAQLEYGVRVTPATPFHVASVSKQFTAFAVALLARDGRVTWDDDVRAHLFELPDLGHPVTLRQLASHTSGVRDQWELLAMAGWRLDDVITRDQILRVMSRQRELNFTPGSEYLYSNMGYSLLAEVVERVSGRPFGRFLEERVFLPLGMHHTHVHDDHTMIVPGRAYSYRPSSDSPVGWEKAVLSYANQGATSLFTTVEDLARWIGEMEDPRVGDPALWEEMLRRGVLTTGDSLSYGLGLSVASYRGLRTVGHGGADAGFRTNLLYFPEARLGVVVFGAASSFDAGGTARRVAEVLLEDRMRPRAASGGATGTGEGGEEASGAGPPEPGGPLERYQGVYYAPELDTLYRLSVSEGRLVVHHQRHPAFGLEPLGDDRFRGAVWYMRVLEFTRDPNGEINGFRATGNRVRGLRFVRIAEPSGS